jgi:hypothetical protein
MITSVTFAPLYVGYLSMFPTRNGTGVLFIPAHIGSTSSQSNGASHCCVSSRWIAFSGEIERKSATANIQKKMQTILHPFFTTPK